MFILLLHLFAALSAFSEEAPSSNVFLTTVFYDDGGVVYVGLKKVGPNGPESQVVTFPFEGGQRNRIPLPEEIEKRSVIGLIPEKNKVFVLTHGSESEKDGPMLHVFDTAQSKWKKLGQLACPSFTKTNISSTKMIFFCELPETNGKKKRRRSVVAKTLSFGKERLYRKGTWRFPEFLLRYKKYSLILEGNAPEWNRLRLKSEDEEDRIFPAEELFQIASPITPPAE